MNIAELMLIVCCVLVVFVLIIIAVSEPRYTWRDVMTFDDRMAEMNESFAALAREIGEKLIPAFTKAIDATSQFSEALRDLKI